MAPNQYFVELATRQANHSSVAQKHGCIIVNKGQPVAYACNQIIPSISPAYKGLQKWCSLQLSC